MCDSQSNAKTRLMLAKLKQVGKSALSVAAVAAMSYGEPLEKSSENMKSELKKLDPGSLLVDPNSKEKLAEYVKNIATDIDAILSITSQMGNNSDNLIKELIEVVIKASTTPTKSTNITPPGNETTLIPLDTTPNSIETTFNPIETNTRPRPIPSKINEPFIYDSNSIKLRIEEIGESQLIPSTDIQEELGAEIINSNLEAQSTVVSKPIPRRIITLKNGKLCIKK